jgi:acetoin utilization protein AcuB
MSKTLLIKHVMTPFPYSIDAGQPIEAAISLMREHKLRHLPVTDAGALTGLLSDRDIKLMLGPDFAYPDPRELRVRDVMAQDAYRVDLGTPLLAVLDYMVAHRLGSAVVTRQGRLAGVFTATDACRVLAEQLRALEPPPADDAA